MVLHDKLKKYLPSIKVEWYTFWKNWHEVKFYYYGSPRHLRKIRKLQLKIRKIKAENE